MMFAKLEDIRMLVLIFSVSVQTTTKSEM